MRIVRFWTFAFLIAAVLTSAFPQAAFANHEKAGAGMVSLEKSGQHKIQIAHSHTKSVTAKMQCCEKHSIKSPMHCEDGKCKCVDGSCHNVMHKIMGAQGQSLLGSAPLKGPFEFSEVVLASAIAERLKRPPRG